jgi:hypothetical protein
VTIDRVLIVPERNRLDLDLDQSCGIDRRHGACRNHRGDWLTDRIDFRPRQHRKGKQTHLRQYAIDGGLPDMTKRRAGDDRDHASGPFRLIGVERYDHTARMAAAHEFDMQPIRQRKVVHKRTLAGDERRVLEPA